MVVCTGVSVYTLIHTQSDRAKVAAAAGLGVTAGSTAVAVGTGVAVGKAAAVGAAGGAISGASASGTLVGACIGALIGGTAAAGVGGSGVGEETLTGTVSTGRLGLLAIGTSVNSEDGQITYDCWKPVVHDKSTEPSSGMLLRDMVNHPNVAKVTMTTGICTEFPNIVIENIWQETYEIQYLLIHSTGMLAGHAKPVENEKV